MGSSHSEAQRLPAALEPLHPRPSALGGRRGSQLLFFAAVLVFWQLGAQLGLWETYLFPAPLDVGRKLVHGFASGVYLKGSGITLLRLLEGYVISAVVGVALGVGIRHVPLLDRTLGSLIVGLQALPSVCWLPIALLWFGLSQTAIIFVVVMGALLSITVATEQGITGMKLGWAFAWRSLMAAELLYVSGGLGQLLMMGREFNDIAEMVAVMVVIVVIGLASDRLVFAALERKVRERFGYDRA